MLYKAAPHSQAPSHGQNEKEVKILPSKMFLTITVLHAGLQGDYLPIGIYKIYVVLIAGASSPFLLNNQLN